MSILWDILMLFILVMHCCTFRTRKTCLTSLRAGWNLVEKFSLQIIIGIYDKPYLKINLVKFLIRFIFSGPKPWSDDFIVYVEQRGYDLLTVSEYENTLAECGFINVKCQDITWTFVDYLIKELERFITNKAEFVQVLFIFKLNYFFIFHNNSIKSN